MTLNKLIRSNYAASLVSYIFRPPHFTELGVGNYTFSSTKAHSRFLFSKVSSSIHRDYLAMDISMYEKPVVSDRFPGSMSTSNDGLSHDLPHLDPIDRAVEKRLVRKCDLYVIPVLSLLYSLAFIDRINIGNARLQGLEKDLKMKGQDYDVALFVFFIPYILFEVPSNLLIRKIAPSTWLSSIMILWGIEPLSSTSLH